MGDFRATFDDTGYKSHLRRIRLSRLYDVDGVLLHQDKRLVADICRVSGNMAGWEIT